MAWTILFHEVAESEYLAQPADIQAQFERIKNIVIAHGLFQLPGKFFKHISGPVWEFRLNGKDGIARALYVTRSGQRIIVVRVFTKKTEKTPRGEIEIALRRSGDVP